VKSEKASSIPSPYRRAGDQRVRLKKGVEMKYLKVAAIVGIVSLCVFFWARSDYRWADLAIRQETPNGWNLIHREDNLADLFLPWTWIKAPVTGLWFIADAQTQRLNQQIYTAHILRVSYDYSKTDREELMQLVNVQTKESAFLKTKQELLASDINAIKWHKHEPGTPGDAIIKGG
jgi:hypothetical protein